MPLRAQGGLNHLDKTPCLGVCGLALALEVLHQFLERHLQACMSALRFRLGDATSVCRRLARLLRFFPLSAVSNRSRAVRCRTDATWSSMVRPGTSSRASNTAAHLAARQTGHISRELLADPVLLYFGNVGQIRVTVAMHVQSAAPKRLPSDVPNRLHMACLYPFCGMATRSRRFLDVGGGNALAE